MPEALVEQLADDGVMLLPLGPQSGTQRIVKVTKSEGEVQQDELIPVRFVPLLPGQAREL
jgi:protein-L-isoaspartate(D-aspartate) O-methyltransferase